MKRDTSVFPKKTPPGPMDWMSVHIEKVQSLEDFRRKYSPKTDDKRRKLYVQPLQLGKGMALVNVKVLEKFLSSFFFGLETEVLPELLLDGFGDGADAPFPVHGFEERISHRDRFETVQLLTVDVLKLLQKLKDGLKDARCVLAVTSVDLYPQEDWNFVFGQASPKLGVGVFSFARYSSKKDKLLELTRCLRVMVHESLHLFGVHHCQKYQCIMNGANSLEETDNQPMYLCPECLDKLVVAQPGLDIAERYRRLIIFFSENKMGEQAMWCSWRLKELEQ